jgi:hypothetical protein
LFPRNVITDPIRANYVREIGILHDGSGAAGILGCILCGLPLRRGLQLRARAWSNHERIFVCQPAKNTETRLLLNNTQSLTWRSLS